jgi:SAM-dependent methyltransferase
LVLGDQFTDHIKPRADSRTRSLAAMPTPLWFWRFMYDRESAAWERRRDEPEHRELVERTADELANVLTPPGPVADPGCGPGAHALALARRGYDIVGVDGSPRMVEIARTRAERDKVDATYDVHDVSAPLRFAAGRGTMVSRRRRSPRWATIAMPSGEPVVADVAFYVMIATGAVAARFITGLWATRPDLTDSYHRHYGRPWVLV